MSKADQMPEIDLDFLANHPQKDSDWDEEQWKILLGSLVDQGVFNWREITSLALGHLNPSQVGTSIASNKNFQAHFPPRKTWVNVRNWYFHQNGCCADCETRLELQADHLIPKEIVSAVAALIYNDINAGLIRDVNELNLHSINKLELELGAYTEFLRTRLKDGRHLPFFSDDLKSRISAGIARCTSNNVTDRKTIEGVADQLENMVLRCRRCNVVRRPSHKNGGLAFLTTEAALMWILFVKRPINYQSFKELCRAYGMTMADIRFQEAWAMAKWLQQEGLYNIDNSCQYF